MSAGFSVPSGSDGKAILNLGCGSEPNSAFVNVDLVAAAGVIAHDLREGIPFPDGSFDLVYHSTMLSHLKSAAALALTRECHRVLKPGGVLRVVTEDLEQMCRVYLQKLEEACAGNNQSAKDYEWMLLELYDQATREHPGGGMADYFRQDSIPNEAFVYERVGEQGRRMMAGALSRRTRPGKGVTRPGRPSLRARARTLLLTALFGRDGLNALEVGRFRTSSGQVSYRMYDRYSLRQLFLAAGFSDVLLRTAKESGYPSWDTVNLDLSQTGEVARPHALIMEGTRALAHGQRHR